MNMKENPIDEYVKGYTKQNTIWNYKKALNDFFKAVKQDPMTYFDKKRDYDQDMFTFIEYLKNKSPLTLKMRLNTVKNFFEENGINTKTELSMHTKKIYKLKTRNCKPVTDDIVCSPDELKKILQYGTLKDRALFLFLSSSGCRVDEALHITFDDLDLTQTPAKVSLSASITKTNESRITFISEECQQTLIEWKKHRPKYLHQACNKSIFKKFENDPKVFPFSYPTAHRMWCRLLEQSGYTEKDRGTKRYRRHIHTLRKFFRIYFAPSGSSDVAELLLGHSDPLNNVYRDRYPESKLKESYLKAMPDISIFERSHGFSEVHQQISELKQENQEMKSQIMELRLEKLEKKN